MSINGPVSDEIARLTRGEYIPTANGHYYDRDAANFVELAFDLGIRPRRLMRERIGRRWHRPTGKTKIVLDGTSYFGWPIAPGLIIGHRGHYLRPILVFDEQFRRRLVTGYTECRGGYRPSWDPWTLELEDLTVAGPVEVQVVTLLAEYIINIGITRPWKEPLEGGAIFAVD
jgi:hypothetical protein